MFINLNLIGLLNTTPSEVRGSSLASLKAADSGFTSLLSMLTSKSPIRAFNRKTINTIALTATINNTLLSRHMENVDTSSINISNLQHHMRLTKNKDIKLTVVPEKLLKKILRLLETKAEKNNIDLENVEFTGADLLKADAVEKVQKLSQLSEEKRQINISMLILPDMEQQKSLYLITMNGTAHGTHAKQAIDTSNTVDIASNNPTNNILDQHEHSESYLLEKTGQSISPDRQSLDVKNQSVSKQFLISKSLIEMLKDPAIDLDNILSSINKSKISKTQLNDFTIEPPFGKTQGIKNQKMSNYFYHKNSSSQWQEKGELRVKTHVYQSETYRPDVRASLRFKWQGHSNSPSEFHRESASLRIQKTAPTFITEKSSGHSGSFGKSAHTVKESNDGKIIIHEKSTTNSLNHHQPLAADESLTKNDNSETIINQSKTSTVLIKKDSSVKDVTSNQSNDTDTKQRHKEESSGLLSRPLEHQNTEQGTKHINSKGNTFNHVITKIKEHIVTHQENSRLHTIKLSIDTGSKGNIDLKVMIHNGTVRADIVFDNINDLLELKNNIASLYSSLQQDGFTPGRFSFNLKNKHKHSIPLKIDAPGPSGTELKETVVSEGIYNLSIRI